MNIEQAWAIRGEVDSYERQENGWLLAEILQCSVLELKLRLKQELSMEQESIYISALERLQKGEPLAYILGSQPFWSLDLIVSTDTLVPRPDTEIVIETILELGIPEVATMVDLGTGSGAIALSLASERPSWQVYATDIYNPTLDIARKNAMKHNLERVYFQQGAWFDAFKGVDIKFDLVVSNPPYIAEDDQHLNALHYEPRRALVAENNGLSDLEEIIKSARNYLKNQGWIVLEHGYNQAEDVQNLLKHYGYTHIKTVLDYAGNPRVSLGRWFDTF